MSFPTIPLPSIWDLPVAAGVPALLGQSVGGGIRASASSLLGEALEDWQIDAAAAQWGIYSADLTPVLTGASFRAIDFQSEHRVSDAPLEQGSFTSYNKVKVPFGAAVELICDGTRGLSLMGFISAIQALEADTALYTIITPGATYASVNIVGHRYRRSTEGGITMITAQLLLQEVRVTGKAGYTSTQTPAGQPNTAVGRVQTADIPNASSLSFGGLFQ